MQDMNPIEFFFAHTDTLGMILFFMLVLMSLASWFGIVGKALLLWQLQRRGRQFRRELWEIGRAHV